MEPATFYHKATIGENYDRNIVKYNLAQVVTIHNDHPADHRVQEAALLRLVDCLAPSGKDPDLQGVSALHLNGAQLLDHPIFKAANILNQIWLYANNKEEDKLPALREPFMELIKPLPEVVSLYFRHRFHLRMSENFESAWALVHALNLVTCSSTLLLAAQRCVRFDKMPYITELYRALFRVHYYQPVDTLKDRVIYFQQATIVFERETFDNNRKDCAELIKREPAQAYWRACAAMGDLNSWCSGFYYIGEKLTLIFDSIKHVSDALRIEPSNPRGLTALSYLLKHYKVPENELDSLVTHLSQIIENQADYPYKDTVLEIVKLYKNNKAEYEAGLEEWCMQGGSQKIL